MTNIAGVPAFGGGGFAFRQPPDPPEPAVSQVAETALNGTATYTKGNDLPGQMGEPLSYNIPEPSETAASEPSRVALEEPYEKAYDISSKRPEDILTGPTPAFQASVLEVELDLRNTIAELAAKRSQSKDEEAIAPRKTEEQRSAAATRETADVQRPDPEPAQVAAEDAAKELAKEQTAALSATPSEALDPETEYAGPAAIQRTPYEPG